MSQRLHVGATTSDVYDCVLTEASDDTEAKLVYEWFAYSGEYIFGPMKVIIKDIELWRQIEPVVRLVFEGFSKTYPDDVWYFYFNGKRIKHPTQTELEAFLCK